ncbi:hypothetical protein SAMN06295967_11248 [Belliella buryatensis]|uniref:AhpC/TSA family protein n=1 Tax=Belliella buryatensis TaxID=1500549 RepID=A0A239FCN1_9BACT|nr:hypothetical protein [Belliella buryatensis]SNS54587.1 hypothetical protein SAMN06295967_11248 [Belliella buryatensis]
MKTSLKITPFIIIVLAFSFCNTKNNTENVVRNGESLANTVLTLPDSLTLYKSEFSEVPRTVAINSTSVVVFINVSCVTCIDELDYWLENSAKLQEKNIPMIFILRASDDFYFFKFLIENENKELPEGSFYLDIKDEFRVLNEKLLTHEVNTFLIDQGLKVIKSGNPIKSSSFAKDLFEWEF